MDERTMPSMPRRLPLLSALRGTALALGLAALALGPAGCSTKDPIMRVQGAQITGGSIGIQFPGFISAGVNMLIYVSGENQNSFDIQLRGIRGQVAMMNGRYILPVSTPLGVWLPSDRTTPFQFPVNVPIQAGLGILSESRGMTCIPYMLQGSADVTATSTFKLNQDNYPVIQSGCIPRAALVSALQMSGNPTAM